MNKTGIEWCDLTWNPVRGCLVVSAGCKNCYAAAQAHRFSGPGRPFEGFARAGKWTGKVALIERTLTQGLQGLTRNGRVYFHDLRGADPKEWTRWAPGREFPKGARS